MVELDRNSVKKTLKCGNCKLFFENEDHLKKHNSTHHKENIKRAVFQCKEPKCNQ